MVTITWQDLDRRLTEFKEDADNKMELFDGYDNLLEKSFRCRVLTLPPPFHLLVNNIYNNVTHDKHVERIKAVQEIIEDIRGRGQRYYELPRFQDLLRKMENASGNVPEHLQRIQQILISDDETSALRIIADLEKEFYEKGRLAKADDRDEGLTTHKKKLIEAYRERMTELNDIIMDSYNRLPLVPSGVKDSEDRIQLRKYSNEMYEKYLDLRDRLNVDMTEYRYIIETYRLVESLFDDGRKITLQG